MNSYDKELRACITATTSAAKERYLQSIEAKNPSAAMQRAIDRARAAEVAGWGDLSGLKPRHFWPAWIRKAFKR